MKEPQTIDKDKQSMGLLMRNFHRRQDILGPFPEYKREAIRLLEFMKDKCEFVAFHYSDWSHWSWKNEGKDGVAGWYNKYLNLTYTNEKIFEFLEENSRRSGDRAKIQRKVMFVNVNMDLLGQLGMVLEKDGICQQ
jgi:hypothetical protein